MVSDRNNGSGRDTALWRGRGGGEENHGGSCAASKVVLVEIVEGEGGYLTIKGETKTDPETGTGGDKTVKSCD